MRFSVLFIFWFATYVGFSQTEWESLNGPFGGSVEILLQSEQLTLFAGTKQGLFRRPVESSEWSFVSDLGDSEIKALISGKNEELFLSNGTDHTIYRSLDDGANWTILPLENVMGFDHIALSSSGTLILAEGNSIWISRDKGQSAEKVVLPGDIRIMSLAASESGWLVAGTNKGLYSSDNDGEVWSEFKNGLPTTPFITQLAIDKEGRTVLSTVENQVYLLESEDTTFGEVSMGLEDMVVTSFAMDDSYGLLAGTLDGTIHILDSTGVWTPLAGSKSNADGKVLEVLVGRQGKIYFARSSTGVEVYDQSCNCVVSINQGLTATEIHAILIFSDQKLIVSTRHELFMYSAADNSWNEIKVGDRSIGARCLMQASDGKIFAGGSDGVLEIGLENDHAFVDSIGPFGYSISFLAEDSHKRLIAGSMTDGLLRRETENGDWVDVRTMEMLGAALTDIHVVEDSSIYVSFHQGIFKSLDDGDSWSIAIDGIPQVGSIVTDSEGNVFGSSFPGVVKSTDRGSHWEHVPVGDNDPVTSLLSVDMSSLYAGSMEGIFRSKDNGESWEAYNQGLGVKSIASLLQDAEGNIYAGTLGGGVYLLRGAVSATNSLEPLSLEMQIVPNPTSGSILLIPRQQVTGDVNIRVYAADLEIVLEENQFFSKSGKGKLEVSNLIPGLYFISVRSKVGTATKSFIKM